MAKSYEKYHKVELRVFRGQSEFFTPKYLFLLYAFKQHRYFDVILTVHRR